MSTAQTTPAPAAPRKRRLMHRLQEWAVILALLMTVAGWLGDLWWIFDLCNHFRLQYVMVLGVLVITSLLMKQWIAVVFVVVGLVLNITMVAPLFSPGVDNVVTSAEKPPLHVLAFNVHTANQRTEDVASFIAGSNADIVLVQEINDRWDKGLRERLDGYTPVLFLPREDNFGIGVLVRKEPIRGGTLTIEAATHVDVSDGVAQVPAIEVRGTWRGKRFAMLGIHTLPPVRASIAAVRDAQITGAGHWVNRQKKAGLPAIVIGDLNATPWCAPFRHLMEDTGLMNSMDGRGMQGTFHARAPALLRIPIDHCLHTADLSVPRREVGGDGVGSDHLPVSVWIEWKE